MAGVKARQAAKVQNGWTSTNYREMHFRIEGRVCGKIQRAPDWAAWKCHIHNPRLTYVGDRASTESAMKLVERAVQAREAKRKVKP